MITPAILERVRDLQSQLAETPEGPSAVAPAEVASLKQALDVVMLDPTQPELYSSLRDRLLLAYVGFQIDHPELAGAMQGLIEALNAAGI